MQKTQKFNSSEFRTKLSAEKVKKGVKNFGKSFLEPIFKPGSITERTEYQKALSTSSKVGKGIKTYLMAYPSVLYQPIKAASKKFQIFTNPVAAKNFKEYGIRNMNNFTAKANQYNLNSNKYDTRIKKLEIALKQYNNPNNTKTKNEP
jgi:hypothetical protein